MINAFWPRKHRQKSSQNKNVYVSICERECIGTCYNNHDLKIIRNLIISGARQFEKVWEKHSKKNICYENGRVFSENFKQFNYGYGSSRNPLVTYRLPPLSPGQDQKIEDALVCSVPPESLPLSHQSHLRSLMCITSNSWLIRYDLKTGVILQQIYLSNLYKFREISWIELNKSIVITSTLSALTSFARQAGLQASMMMAMVIFEVCPLRFVGLLEINKKLYGTDVSSATVSNDMLITMHQSGLVKFYSLEYIIQKYKVFEATLFEKYGPSEEICGHLPIGLPFNIKVTETPPVLFQVRCSDHNVHIGGFPWHYIITPQGTMGYFEVHSLENDKLAENGDLDMNCLSPEPDRAVFHNDESGRILHIGPTQISVLKIITNNSGVSCIETSITIPVESQRKKDEPCVSTTSSGRVIKRKVSMDELGEGPDVTIHEVDYEDDLDVLFVSAVFNEPDQIRGVVRLHDNLTGELLRDVQLLEPFATYNEHHVWLDLDTIVQVLKLSQGKFVCYVYRLVDKVNENEEKEEWQQLRKSRISRPCSTVRRSSHENRQHRIRSRIRTYE